MKKLIKKGESKIILASKSPRRSAILKQFGLPFRIVESDYQETTTTKNTTSKILKHIVMANAKGKALAVAKSIDNGIILGVDTLVLFGNKVIGKPGGYGAQEKGAIFIERIEGDFYNVVGLPVSKFLTLAIKLKVKL